MPRAICEDCGSLVAAEVTHNGVCAVGHYVHCGWGHELHLDDLISDEVGEIVAGLEKRLAKAVEAGVDVAASLNAAISLLERGGKKAAASDRMFAQMLLDYNASLDRFRTTLAELKQQK